MLEKKRKHRSLNAANPQISIKRLKRDVTTLCELFDEFPSSPPNNQQCHTRSSFISIGQTHSTVRILSETLTNRRCQRHLPKRFLIQQPELHFYNSPQNPWRVEGHSEVQKSESNCSTDC